MDGGLINFRVDQTASAVHARNFDGWVASSYPINCRYEMAGSAGLLLSTATKRCISRRRPPMPKQNRPFGDTSSKRSTGSIAPLIHSAVFLLLQPPQCSIGSVERSLGAAFHHRFRAASKTTDLGFRDRLMV